MRKYLLSLATVLFAFGLAPVGAQDQAPPPYDNSGSSSPYDQRAPSPYNNQGAPAPYNNQSAPSPYDNNQGNNQGQNNQDDDNQSADAQPGIARVSFVQGDVSSQRGDSGDWVALTVNAPISAGDRIATGANSRAEIQLDGADVLRLSSNTTANIVNLTRTAVQVQVGQGLANYSVVRSTEANPEIDTPNASIHPNGAGDFRIVVESDSDTRVTVRRGSADISTPQGSTSIDQSQMITIQGTDDPQYRTDAATGRDDFDTWNDERDRHITSAQSWHNTDPYYTGSEDLDTYGVWSEVPDYGRVWTPSSPDPNWAPYREGRWVWTPYYGWTWVSTEPWGWAPYHYGRWFVYGGRWSWWPGPVAIYPSYYPVWAPAYVSFFGWGGAGFGVGFGVGFGFGSVGWLPLGPCDWFHPWWGGWGRGYRTYGFAEGNRFHEGFGPLAGERGFGGRRFSNIDGIQHEGRLQSGVSSMSSRDFGRGAVPRSQQRFDGASLRNASMVSGRMPISPSRQSFSPSGRAANPSSLRSVPSSSQHFFSSNSRGSSGFGGNRGGANNAASNNSGNRAGSPGSFERPSGTNSVSNRGSFGNTGNSSNRSGGFGGANSNSQSSGGWQHFSPSSRGSQSQGFNNRGSASPNQRSFDSPGSASRGGTSNSYSRPPLNMRQPIVTPRNGSSGNSSGSQYGNSGGFNSSRGATSRGAEGGIYSAPSNSGGTFNSPRGASNDPRFGGESSRGGGTYSEPRGNSGGGYSRGSSGGGSSRGSGHSGGGHSNGGGHHH